MERLRELKFLFKHSKNKKDGHTWVYNTMDEWIEQLPFYTKRSIERDMRKLEKLGLVISNKKHNKMKSDRTKWYRIDYEELHRLTEAYRQNGGMDTAKMTDCDTAKMAGSNHKTTTHKKTKILKPANTSVVQDKTESDSGETIPDLDGEDEASHLGATASTLKSGAKHHGQSNNKIGSSSDDVALQFAKEEHEPKVGDKISFFERYYEWVMYKYYGAATVSNLTMKQKGQIKLIKKKAGKYYLDMYPYILSNWMKFAVRVSNTTDNAKRPEVPHVGYFLVHIDLAVKLYLESLKAPAKVQTGKAPDPVKIDKPIDKPEEDDKLGENKYITLPELLAMDEEESPDV